MAEKKEILSCIALLSMAYPKEAEAYKNVSTLEFWVTMLLDIPGVALLDATRECIATLTWWPKIAELREMAFRLMEATNPIPDALAAWSEVQQELRRVGHFAGRSGYELNFSHPLIEQMAMGMGWEYLCFSENHVADRAQFIHAYQARREKMISAVRMLPETCKSIAAKRYSLPALGDGAAQEDLE